MSAIVAAVIERLSRQYPRMMFHVRVADTAVLLSELQERNLDLAISRIARPNPEKDLKAEVLFHDPLVVMTAQTNPWARRRNFELADLLEEPWILPPPHVFLGQFVAAAFHARGLALPKSSVITASVHMRHNMLATGRFMAMLPSVMLRFPIYRGLLKALPIDLPETRRPVAFVTLKKRDLSPVAKLFLNCAREIVSGLSIET
jgi:DNA-binding transcriptional LysR family regulator